MKLPLIPVPFILILAGGAVGGIAVYILVRCYWGGWPREIRIFQTGLAGIGIVAGLHLSYGAIVPDSMIEFLDPHGRQVHRDDVFVKVADKYESAPLPFCEFGEWHTAHILVAGLATAIGSALALINFCRLNPHPDE